MKKTIETTIFYNDKIYLYQYCYTNQIKKESSIIFH